MFLFIYIYFFFQHEKFTSQLQLGKKLGCTESPKTPKSSPAKGAESKAAELVTEPPARVAETCRADEKMQGRHKKPLYDIHNYVVSFSAGQNISILV